MVPGPFGLLVAQTVEEGSGDDGIDVADGQDDDGEVVVVDRLIAGDPFVDFRERHGAAAVASAHDGQDVVGEDAAGGDAEDQAGKNAEDGGAQDTAQDGRQVAHEGADEDLPVQGEDGARDQDDDEEGQEVLVAHEGVDVLEQVLGDQVKVGIDGRPQESQEDTATDIGVPDGDPVAQLIERDADSQHQGHDVGEALIEHAQGGTQVDDRHASQGDIPWCAKKFQSFFVFHNSSKK